MTRSEKSLSNATGIPVDELEYKNEVQIIRPSEAIEAMREVAVSFAEWIDRNRFIRQEGEGMWFNYATPALGEVDSEEYTTEQLFQKFNEQEDGK